MRFKKNKVKTARGRKASSTRWLQRQLNDPYVQKAKKDGYRSRASYKLKQIDEKFGILKSNQDVLDLGCAPGSWLQVAIEKVKKGKILGIDLKEIDEINGATAIKGDIFDTEVDKYIKEFFPEGVDLVLSDMAASSTGHPKTDHLKIIGLLEAALDLSQPLLKDGASFVGKVLRGGAEKEILEQLKKNFSSVKHFKPDASRQDSSEMYVVAKGFKR